MAGTNGVYGQGAGVLSKGADMVVAAKGDLNKIAKNLDGQVLGLSGGWKGQGGSAFFALHQAWMEKQQRIVNILDQFEASLRGTEKDNVNTDTAQSSNFGTMAGKLSAI